MGEVRLGAYSDLRMEWKAREFTELLRIGLRIEMPPLTA